MTRFHRLFAFALLFLFMSAVEGSPFPSFIEFDGRLGSYREGAGVVFWKPICERCDRVTFVQGQAGNYRDLWTGNIGIGHRQLFCPNLAFGLNAFGDVSYSTSGRTYGQGSVGAELLGTCWELRANGYLTHPRSSTIRDNEIIPGNIIINGNTIEADFNRLVKEELTYYGFDFELGRGICFECGQLWGYAGYYYFTRKGGKDIQGPRLRLEYQIDNPLAWYGTRLTVGGEYFYDPVHRSEGSLLVSFRIPLCARAYRKNCMSQDRCSLSVCRQMGNRVRREPTVWVERLDRRRFEEDDLGEIFFVNSTLVAAAGTQIDPTSLQDAVNRAGIGDFIFLLNDGNPVDGGAGILVMQPNQTVIGFGDNASTAIDFGPFGVLTITDLNPPPHRATLTGTAGNVITVANGATVRGIQIDGLGTADNGIAGAGVSDITIFDIDSFSGMGIANTAIDGIRLSGTRFDIRDVTFNSITQSALNVSGSQVVIADIVTDMAGNGVSWLPVTNGTLTNAVIRMSTDFGIVLEGANHTLTNINIEGAANEGLSLNGVNGFTGSDILVSNSGSVDLFLDQNSGTITFDQTVVTSSSPSQVGILIAGGTGPVTFTNSTHTQTDNLAIDIDSNSALVDLTGLAVNYSGTTAGQVIFVQGNTAPVQFANVTLDVASAGVAVVDLTTNAGQVSFNNLRITETGGTGLAVRGVDLANLSITNSIINTTGATPPQMIRVINTNTNGTLSFAQLALTAGTLTGGAPNSHAVDIQAIDNSSVTASLTRSTLNATTIAGVDGAGIRMVKSGNGAGSSMEATVDQLVSTIGTAGGGHIRFETDSSLNHATYMGTATVNELNGSAGGIAALLGSAAGSPVVATLHLSENTIAGTTVSTINVNDSLVNATDSVSVTIDQNLMSASGVTDGPFISGVSGSGALNSVITGNVFNTTGTGIGYQGDAAPAFVGTVCMTLAGNSSNATTGISLQRQVGAGPFTVTPTTSTATMAADLLTANPGISGTVSLLPAASDFNPSTIPCLP